MSNTEPDTTRVQLALIGNAIGFWRINVDGEHFGYLSREPVHGYEVYKGTNWPDAQLLGRTFNLRKALLIAYMANQ